MPTGCEFSQLAKFRRLLNFAPCEIPRQILLPLLEHLQQNKTKNYEKLSLINKEIYYIWKLKEINENPNLKIEIQ